MPTEVNMEVTGNRRTGEESITQDQLVWYTEGYQIDSRTVEDAYLL